MGTRPWTSRGNGGGIANYVEGPITTTSTPSRSWAHSRQRRPDRDAGLGSTSPAIDKVPPRRPFCADTVDQRGVKRPQGPACDIVSFELVPLPKL
jgi:hypothetical protein